MDKFLHEDKFSFLWEKCPNVQLRGHVLSLFSVLQGTAKLLSVVAAPFTFPPAAYRGPNFSAASSAPPLIC